MDAPLYRMLNPETERVKLRIVPYKLKSQYDYYEPKVYSKEYMKEGVSQLSFKVQWGHLE